MKKDSLNREDKLKYFNEIEKARMDLDVALECFNSASMDLVDYYSYRIKAAEAKYDYLIKFGKDMNISKFK